MPTIRSRTFVSPFLALLLAGACAPRLSNRPDLGALMAAYRTEGVRTDARRDSVARARISRLSVAPAPGFGSLVTLDATDASLRETVRAVLSAAELPYVLDNVELTGTVTARLERRPVLDALNDLLSPHGYIATIRDSLVRVGYGSRPAPGGTERPDDVVQAEVPIFQLDSKAVAALLDGMLRGGALHVAFIAPRSVVLLAGPRRDVEDARQLLHRADRPSDHVFIEALVVEFDVETMRNVAVSLSGGQKGRLSALTAIPGNLSGDLLTFMHSLGAQNPQQFIAIIQAIAGADKARVVARPFISTRSGEPANLDIGRIRTYLTQTLQTNGALSVGQATVPSGVVLRMVPLVLPGDRVRIDTHVEESQFLPTSGNVANEKDQNIAESSMQVPSGETIIIGGLSLDRSSATESGIPVLRHIPLLRALFSNDAQTGKRQEVVIFLTPRIWHPGLDAPLVLPGAFDLDSLMKPFRRTP